MNVSARPTEYYKISSTELLLLPMLPQFAPRSRLNFQLLAILFIALSPVFSLSQDQLSGELHGKVCDVSGRPIASATVTLKAEGQSKPLAAQTRTDGTFSFQSLPLGSYRLQVSAAGFVNASVPAVPVPSGKKNFEIILKPEAVDGSTSSHDTPQFFDQPQFTVSGVTDTSDLGGHGSGPIMRNRESVEKDVHSLSASSTPPASSSKAYDRALADANSGDYMRARDELQSLPAQQQTAQTHHLLAVVDEKLGNSLDAVQEYQRAAELAPTESNTFDWGSELLLHHAAEPAIQVFTKGNRLFPNSTRMLLGLGAAEFSAGSYERAVQRLCQASDLRPDDPLPYLFLAKIQRTENTVPAEVLDRFQRFLNLRPNNAEANFVYAAALWKQNLPTPADHVVAQVESLLKTALRLDPKLADAHLQLGIVHAYQQNSAAAIADFQHAIESQPDLEEAHYRLAQAYRVSGKIDEARAEIAVYKRLRQQSQQQTEREHHEIKQFVYSLRDQTPAQAR
jgi:Tfp pilus assembly protein PilF